MAQRRVITEGFELYPSNINLGGYGIRSTWLTGSTDWIMLDTGRFGGQCLRFQSGNDHRTMYRPFTPTTAFVVGFAFYRGSTLDVTFLRMRSQNNNDQVTMRVDSSGYIYINRGGTQLWKSSTPLIVVDSWNYLELAAVISDTTGSIRFYMNDVEVEEAALDNVDTKNHATDIDVGQILLEGRQNHRWDDLYVEIDGTTRVGEGRIVALPVTADDTVEFTPSTGSSNYATVDEIPVNPADYNFSAVVGDKDLFAVGDLSFSPQKIYGVQVSYIAQKDEAGLRIIRNRLVSNGVEENGTNFVLALNTFNWKRDFWPLNPDGNIEWVKPAVDGIKIGYEVVA